MSKFDESGESVGWKYLKNGAFEGISETLRAKLAKFYCRPRKKPDKQDFSRFFGLYRSFFTCEKAFFTATL